MYRKEIILKFIKKLTFAFLLVSLCVTTGFSRDQHKKKLPIGAYISQAKIEIISGDPERLRAAIDYLNDLFEFYGPQAEALFWMGQIEVDFINKTSNPKDKLPHVERFIDYTDSLKICCDKDNKKVKSKYKKNCDEYITKADSTIVEFWRTFYNDAVNQMNSIKDKQDEITANEADSSYAEKLQAELDTVVMNSDANYNLCIALDPNDVREYVGLGSLYEKVKNYEKAIEWLVKGLDHTEDRDQLLLPVSYNYFNIGNYVGAIPYLKEYVDRHPDDTTNMGYLVICYNNKKSFDSAFIYNEKILEIAPNNTEALNSVGHFYGQLSRDANDSASVYRDADNEAKVKEWNQTRSDYLDSALVYYKKSLAVNPDDKMINELFATYSYIQQNFEDAVVGFKKLSELDPSQNEIWRSLGDCYIQTKEFANAAKAYEKAVEIKPDDKAVWEQLVSLYTELKMPKEKAAAQKKVDALK